MATVQQKAKLNKKNKTSHETSKEMVIDLLKFINYDYYDLILDAGSGKNKVWFNSIKSKNKLECEIEDGIDFLQWNKPVDWTIGNPPFHLSWDFTKKALLISKKGIAWLLNINNLNSIFSPKRLEFAKSLGFQVSKIIVVEDKRWFGRYFFVIYLKENGILTWIKKKYGTN